MDTSGLRGFAVWARVALIREVAGRVAAVLAPGSVQRVEQPVAVGTLERAVAAAGGGEAGRAAVADTVAYTWFNRIIALRFMDANGYTGVGVVSPQAGVTVGQPEILADAKRGVLDAEVISTRTQQTVMALLDGTRHSPDPQGEAYGLLLAEYCRFWNRAMPFMFEPEGDFTEMLMPANLLADDSVLNRAVSVLAAQVCADVEVIGWLYQFYISERKDEVFAGFKKNKKAGQAEIPAATQLFTPHWIVRYLVENSLGRLWLLNHPDSRLVEQMDYYIPPVDAETDFLKISSPEDITIIDPACGSGHMLTYAFDLLYAIYQEEGYAPSHIPELILTHNLYGTEIDPRAGTLAAFALTMKATAKRKLFLKNPVQPNICVIEPISFTDDELDYLLTAHGDRSDEETFWNQFRHADLLGSLIQPDPHLTTQLTQHLETLDTGDDLLNADTIQRAQRVVSQAGHILPRYSVVVANPPYMGAKNMDSVLSDFATYRYPTAKADLFALFIQRNCDLAMPGGEVAMITMQSWMFIRSFQALRQDLLANRRIQSLVHLGTGAFDSISGEVVSTVAWVMAKRPPSGASTIVSVLDGRGAEKEVGFLAAQRGESARHIHHLEQQGLLRLPGAPLAYWLGERVTTAFIDNPSVGSLFEIKVGMQTSNNAKYLRQWWEVSASAIATGEEGDPEWVWYAKGGPFRRWSGNLDSVLHYKGDPSYVLSQPNATILPLSALQHPKITWTHMSPGRVSFRLLPAHTFHDIGSHAIYVDDQNIYGLLGYLNTAFVGDLIQALNPTVNIQTSDVARVPIVDMDSERIASLAREAVDISTADEMNLETSSTFCAMPLVVRGRIQDAVDDHYRLWRQCGLRLREIEAEIEAAATEATGVESHADPSAVNLVNDGLAEAMSWTRERCVEMVSYAVGCMLGRYSMDQPGLILADQGATVQDYLAKVPQPRFIPDVDNVLPIVDGDWFEDDIVARFREFLRVAFGEEHLEENLRFVTQALEVTDVRDYFAKSFYKDHVQRYKKRPIYWLFSSPKGSFSALMYVHRYTPSTVSTVLNEYLREFQIKIKASLENAERSNNTRDADRLRKILLELQEYEHDVLYPLATQQIHIDLDDGVKANYPKLGKALKKIPGLETTE